MGMCDDKMPERKILHILYVLCMFSEVMVCVSG